MNQLLSKLITFQSDKNHPQEIKACFDFVVQYLKKKGLKVKTYSKNNKPSLVAARKLKKRYQYILNGHLDVVPANYKNAFKAVVKKNRLHARGAADMKGVDSAMIKLISSQELKTTDAALMLTTDEEVGGFNGVNFLINQKGYSCDCVIVPDGGNNWHLTIAEKGVLHLKISAQGKAAHGSRPWLGENAIEKLIAVYQLIKKEIPDTKPTNRWRPTLNLGKFSGGDAVNKTPARAEMDLDFRYPQRKQREKILNLVEKSIKKIKKTSFQILVEGEIMTIAKNNPYLKKIMASAKKEGIGLKFTKSHSASDARFFSAKNIPVIMFAPIQSQGHIDNEWIDLKSLEKFYQVLKTFLTS